MLKHFNVLAVAAVFLAAPLAHAQGVDEETPEQHAYEGRMDSQMRSWIHEGNHNSTDEERQFIEAHWRRAAKIWRIRRLAAAAKDNASMTRADALLARADHILEDQIRHFRDRAPVMTVNPGAIEVMVAPPPPQVEVQGVAPSPRHVWVPGFWQWNGTRHVWSRGHWAEPPQVGMTYEAPKWVQAGGKWRFDDGRWQVAPTANVVVYEPPPVAQEALIETAPPAPIIEVRPAGPANGVWIPGYWHWNGSRHTWVGGRWSAAKTGMRWEPDHWVRSGTRYQLVHGRWAR